MLGNFTYSNPTKLYFGENALDNLKEELNNYGKTVMLSYGGGSIKKNGIYDEVVKILHSCGKTVIEDSGGMPNPPFISCTRGAVLQGRTTLTLS